MIQYPVVVQRSKQKTALVVFTFKNGGKTRTCIYSAKTMIFKTIRLKVHFIFLGEKEFYRKVRRDKIYV